MAAISIHGINSKATISVVPKGTWGVSPIGATDICNRGIYPTDLKAIRNYNVYERTGWALLYAIHGINSKATISVVPKGTWGVSPSGATDICNRGIYPTGSQATSPARPKGTNTPSPSGATDLADRGIYPTDLKAIRNYNVYERTGWALLYVIHGINSMANISVVPKGTWGVSPSGATDIYNRGIYPTAPQATSPARPKGTNTPSPIGATDLADRGIYPTGLQATRPVISNTSANANRKPTNNGNPD